MHSPIQPSPGRDQGKRYELEGCFSHSSQNGGYYRAILAAMVHFPNSVQIVPEGMNTKGFEALCSFFKGRIDQHDKNMFKTET